MATDQLSFTGVNVVVVGLAREGSAAARFLAEHGAHVAVTDTKPAADLTRWIAPLKNLGISFYLGKHPDTLLKPNRTDLLVVSPGIPLTVPFLQMAQKRGLPLTTESRIFCQHCPAPIVGISGSSGKTTTTTLVGKMLKATGYTTHVGGNIGAPLINQVDKIQPTDRVVLELSSFQLEYFHSNINAQANLLSSLQILREGWSPDIGALLNITPNHLDRHKTMAAYTYAKRSLVDYMKSDQVAVLGWDTPITRDIGLQHTGPVQWFSLRKTVQAGACLEKGYITLVAEREHYPICPADAIKLRGEHNLYNVLAAVAIAHAAGATPPAMATVATTFAGVEHRLELVARQNGVLYINDSIATSPERLMAALKAFNRPIILLAGGKDKKLPWDNAAKLILQRVKHLVLFGQAARLIQNAVEQERPPDNSLPVHLCHTLAQAVAQARALAQPGDVVLLSPGGTSYDAYPDFAARGEHFRQLVKDK